MPWKRVEPRREMGLGAAILNRVIREYLTEKIKVGPRPKGLREGATRIQG